MAAPFLRERGITVESQAPRPPVLTDKLAEELNVELSEYPDDFPTEALIPSRDVSLSANHQLLRDSWNSFLREKIEREQLTKVQKTSALSAFGTADAVGLKTLGDIRNPDNFTEYNGVVRCNIQSGNKYASGLVAAFVIFASK